MRNLFFVGSLMVTLFVLYSFAFRYLPREEWQFLAAVPVKKLPHGQWKAKNLTWYGALMAFSLVSAVILCIVLLRSVEVPWERIQVFLGVLLLLSAPFAKIMAWWVEKKRGTLTIGGAVFVGLLTAPPLAFLLDQFDPSRMSFHAPLLSAVITAYALGEGMGRLACLSFGCCYGKRLSDCPVAIRKIFSRMPLVFRGKTKKASYAGNMEGEKLLPIQAITAIIYTLIAAASTLLFLYGLFRSAFLLSAVGTLNWRFASEFFRADYRGGGCISMYQWMSIFGVLYAGIAASVLPFDPTVYAPDILKGLQAVLDWRLILVSQGLFLSIFLYTGVSVVTESTIEFKIRKG